MYKETLEKVANAALGKEKMYNDSKGKYLVASIMAGFYVGLGIFLIMTIGGLTKSLGPQFKIFIGMAFGIALSLVLVIGSELFTGNNLIMTAGWLNKAVKFSTLVKVWILCYIGNFIGSTLVGTLFFLTGTKGTTASFITGLAAKKMHLGSSDLFFKGILCNVLVCLAVLAYIKMKSESGKLIMIFWTLFAFITSGYEHSVANMSIFTAGLLLKGEGVTLAGYGHNMLWITLGNIVGGSFIGLVVWYLGKEKK